MRVNALPISLSQVIAAEGSRLPQADLVHAAQSLSQAYRREADAVPARLNDASRVAYLAMRLPATYAAVSMALSEMSRVTETDTLRSCLDVGAGPGTASLAARTLLPTISKYSQLERDEGWSELASRLSTALGLQPSRTIGSLTTSSMQPHHLVIATYTLNELPSAALDVAIGKLWSATTSALVVVEPGTPHGFAVVRRVRELCLANGAHAAAPCTHDEKCPMTPQDWCHRTVRVERSALHRRLKDAQLAFEDEKLSYVVMTREPARRIAPSRIVRRPIRAGGHVHLDLCTNDGLARATITRSDRAAYKAARAIDWGDLWPAVPGDGASR